MNSLTILTFHTLDDTHSVISFPPKLFRQLIEKISERGYRTLKLSDVVQHLRERNEFPNDSIVITFDDGYQSVYDSAFSILRDHNMTATVFLAIGTNKPTQETDRLGSLEGRTMLSWREIGEMHQSGIQFGAHTLAHRDLTKLSPEQIEKEMRESKEAIEQRLGIEVNSFAYPFGRHNHRTREIARQYFSCACTDQLALVHRASDPYALERVDAYYLRSERSLDGLFDSFFPIFVRLRRLPRNLRRALHASAR